MAKAKLKLDIDRMEQLIMVLEGTRIPKADQSALLKAARTALDAAIVPEAWPRARYVGEHGEDK